MYVGEKVDGAGVGEGVTSVKPSVESEAAVAAVVTVARLSCCPTLAADDEDEDKGDKDLEVIITAPTIAVKQTSAKVARRPRNWLELAVVDGSMVTERVPSSSAKRERELSSQSVEP